MSKPKVVVADYCDGCPHFNPESASVFADDGTAICTVVQCVYREQCRYAAENTMKLYQKTFDEEMKKWRQRGSSPARCAEERPT